MKLDKIDNLQILRAIAAFLVVLDHTFATAYKNVLPQNSYDSLHSFFNNLGAIGVSVFFALSGFLMVFTLTERKTASNFIVDRIIRIYPPYLIYSIPVIVYSLLSASYDHKITDGIQLIQNILLIPGGGGYSYTNANYPAWTLVYEMFFYFIFSLVLLKTKNKKIISISLLLFFVGLILSSRFIWSSSSYSVLTDFSRMSGSIVLLNFAIGCIIGAFVRYSRNKLMRINFLFLSLFVMLMSAYLNTMSDFNSDYNSFVFGVIPSALIVFFGVISKNVNSKILVLVGNSSYSIYLTHVTFLMIKGKLVVLLSLNSVLVITLINLAFVVAILFLGFFLYSRLENPLTIKIKNHLKLSSRFAIKN